MKPLRYLWVHSAADPWVRQLMERQVKEYQSHGYAVENYVFMPSTKHNDVYYFPALDRKWRQGDAELLKAYERLAEKLEHFDVLVHGGGAGLHPHFLEQLNVYKVFICADDPESTEILSKPVAAYYDLKLVANIAEVETYKAWGLDNVYFWPIGSILKEVDITDMDEARILDINERDIPFVFFGSFGGIKWTRAKRLSRLVSAFPEAYCAGDGWKRGYVDWDTMWSVYRRSQIGWNVHNSTGPINRRLYDLPALGVMQICDNKSHLGQIYKLGEEVIGFDTIDECIELSRYYLAHPLEQREIALRGWKRWKQDYTPIRVWEKLVQQVETHYAPSANALNVEQIRLTFTEHRHKTRYRRAFGEIEEQLQGVVRPILRRGRKMVVHRVNKLRQR